ncbi:MAG: transcriptional regulator [Methanocalculus sp. MSAO_Arc1]|uniref:transcriptional regulator n=1 Tax=Methanocalculus TaxID=71151 RepID=UPI000FEE477C|nr:MULTISPECIES: transcriptional regulator [unclassified Methanocalculus]MCP1661575.1 putative transcriptional regulator [Methanocalculus sp. AMF5]RQD82039.1 MAG: transcriptional regulator [Methanocalculus sp. MSAO_Arc1]
MVHERLIKTVISILISAGYDVSERCLLRPRSFDLLASDNTRLVIIKIVSQIDSVSEEIASDLEAMAHHLRAVPIIIGERARDAPLERSCVYLRYGLFAVAPSTLYDFLVERVPPLVYASPGGHYVNIDGVRLREIRELHNLSLGDLAHILGVSRRTISKYESGMGTTLEMALKLEELFDEAIVEPIDLFMDRPHDIINMMDLDDIQPVSPAAHLQEIGLELHPFRRAPFQAVALYEKTTIFACFGPAQKTVKRAALVGNLSQIAHARSLCILTDYHKEKKIGKTLVIGEEQLYSLDQGSDLVDLIPE